MLCCLCWYGAVGVVAFFLLRYLWELLSVGDLTNKPVVITGCDSGFGFLLALRLLKDGIPVFAGCLTEKGGDELRKKSAGLRGQLEVVILDVSSQDSMDKAKAVVTKKLNGRGLWGLVNNAGIVGQSAIDCFLTVDDYQKVIDVNTLGVIRSTHAFKSLIKKSRGRIVTVASVLGRVGQMGTGPYCVSKHACQGYAEVLRQEMYQFGVAVSVLEPGYFTTALTDPATTQRMFQRVWDRCPQDVKAEYGQDYIGKMQVTIRKMLEAFASNRTDYVVDAYHHALTAKYPRDRYHVGWDSMFFFIPVSILPTWCSDWIFRKVQVHFGIPIPAAAVH